MTQDVSNVRWVLLSLLLHAVRQVSSGSITLSAERNFSDGEWVVFEVSYKLPHNLAGCREERPADLLSDASETDPDVDGWPDEIGLTACRRICEEMHGFVVRAESDGEGVVYTVRLPAGTALMVPF